MANLADAVKAHRAAQNAVTVAQEAAQARVRAAREREAAARLALAAAMVESARDGMRQIDIIKITGYSRERVRSILRAGGVDPDT